MNCLRRSLRMSSDLDFEPVAPFQGSLDLLLSNPQGVALGCSALSGPVQGFSHCSKRQVRAIKPGLSKCSHAFATSNESPCGKPGTWLCTARF